MRPRRSLVALAAVALISLLAVPAANGVDQGQPEPAGVPGTSASIQSLVSTAGITAGEALSATATISASATTNLTGASLVIGLRRTVLTDLKDVSTWLDGNATSTTWGGNRVASTVAVADIEAGQSAQVNINVTAASMSLGSLSRKAGFVPFYVNLVSASGEVIDTSRITVGWYQRSVGSTTLIIPVSAPATVETTYSAAELSELVASSGALSQISAALSGVPGILALDPKLVTSIEAATAPQAAKDWLTALVQGRQVMPLAYGDPDIEALALAGATSLYFGNTADQTLYNTALIALPELGHGSLALTNLAASSGFSQIVLSTAVATDQVPGNEATIGSATALIQDDALAGATQVALRDPTAENLAKVSAARALTANVSADQVLVMPRDWLANPGNLGNLVTALSSSWTQLSGSLPTAANADAIPVLTTLADGSVTVDQSKIAPLVSVEIGAQAFADAITNPESQTEARRLAVSTLQAAAGLGWVTGFSATEPNAAEASSGTSSDVATGWSDALASAESTLNSLATGVHTADLADVQLISASSELPIPVVNSTAYPVQVTLTVTPSNGRVSFPADSISVSIDPNSTTQAKLPVTALANGQVSIEIKILNASGTQLGNSSSRNMQVNAQTESVIMIVVVALAALAFSVGAIRSVILRKPRTVASRGVDIEEDAEAPADSTESTDD